VPNTITVVVDESTNLHDDNDDISRVSDEDTDILSPLPSVECNSIVNSSSRTPKLVLTRCTTFTIEKDKEPTEHSDDDNESDRNEEVGQRSHFGSFYLRIGAVGKFFSELVSS